MSTFKKNQFHKEKAIEAYGDFLTALGFDWKNDPHMKDTPKRVVKAWIEDLIVGCFTYPPTVSSFPNEGYRGMVLQTDIDVASICAHHNLPFTGKAHVAYIPGNDSASRVIGLSKLNRIVDYCARRPNVQENLTKQIHSMVDEVCHGNRGVAVIIEAGHQCVSCRGVRQDSIMKTSELSGYFFSNEVGTRTELFSLLKK